MRFKNTLLITFMVSSFFLLWLYCDKPYDPDSNQGPEECRDTVLTVSETEKLGINIHATDPDNDILDWSIIKGPHCGITDKKVGTIGNGDELVYISNNLITLTTDTLIISVTDFEVSKHITIIINITADNDPPYIPDLDTIRVIKNRSRKFHIPGIDPEGLPVTWEIMKQPLNGTLTKLYDTLSDTTEAQYALTNDSSILDSFEYRVSDGENLSQNATAHISRINAIVLQQGYDNYTGCTDTYIDSLDSTLNFMDSPLMLKTCHT